MIVDLLFRIVVRQRRDDGAQHVHGQGVLGRLPQQADDGGVQLALARQVELQLLQLGAIGQPPKPQQVADFFEGRVVGQLVDVDAAIGEHALIAIDVADAGICGGNAFQPLGAVHHRGHENLSRPRPQSEIRDGCTLRENVALEVQLTFILRGDCGVHHTGWRCSSGMGGK